MYSHDYDICIRVGRKNVLQKIATPPSTRYSVTTKETIGRIAQKKSIYVRTTKECLNKAKYIIFTGTKK